MNILLDDLPFNDSLYPFGAVKSMVHIRIGILTIFEKWQLIFPGRVFISSQQPENADTSLFNKIPANIIPSANFFNQINKFIMRLARKPLRLKASGGIANLLCFKYFLTRP